MHNHINPNITLFSEWILFKLAHDRPTDNLWFEYNCNDARIDFFEHIARQLVNNHDILRYSFCLVQNELKIKINKPDELDASLNCIDYFGQESWKERTFRDVEQAFDKPFNLEAPPFYNFLLVRIGEHSYRFFMIVPHLLYDAHTLHMFYHETDTLYKTLLKGDLQAKILAEDIQFGSYISEQNDVDFIMDNPSGAYWRSHFEGDISNIYLGDKLPYEKIILQKKAYSKTIREFVKDMKPDLNFSLIYILHKFRHYSYRTYLQVLQPDTLKKIELLAKMSNTTVFSIISSCYYLTLYNFCPKPHIPVCYTLSTRNNIRKQKASGMFLNFMLVKRTVNENISALDFIKTTHQKINEMKIHNMASMPRVWSEAGLSEDVNIPLNINYFINQHDVLSDEILKQEGTHRNQNFIFTFDIDIKVMQGRDGLLLYHNYKEELFSEYAIEAFTAKFRQLVDQITDAPYMPVNHFVGKTCVI